MEGQEVVSHQFDPGSPQVIEFLIVLQVFRSFPDAFNLVSDSQYVVNSLQLLETAGPLRSTSTVSGVFQQLQGLIWSRKAKFHALHMRAHTGLPGPLSEGNALVDAATCPVWAFLLTMQQQAAEFHSQFHVNARTLQDRFHISRSDTRDIV